MISPAICILSYPILCFCSDWMDTSQVADSFPMYETSDDHHVTIRNEDLPLNLLRECGGPPCWARASTLFMSVFCFFEF